MKLIEAIAEMSDRAIEELGAPLTLIVAGTDLWVSISRYDAKRETKVLLDAIGEPSVTSSSKKFFASRVCLRHFAS
jgi:hypothetical protein